MLASTSAIARASPAKIASRNLKTRPAVQPSKLYTLEEAIDYIRRNSTQPMDDAYVIHVNLNVPRVKKGLEIQGMFNMPHATGKKITIAALVNDDELAREAMKAGAKYAGDIADKIAKKTENIKPIRFDRLVATYDYFDQFTKRLPMGKELRKRSKRIPSVADHTLVEHEQLVQAVKHHKLGKYVEFSFSPAGIVSTILGKVNRRPERIVENFEYVLRHLYSLRPKKNDDMSDYVVGMHLNGSRCPGGALPLDLDQVLRSVEEEDVGS